MATQMQLKVILIGEVDWRKSIKLIGETRKKLGAGMEHMGVWRVDTITLRKEKLQP